MRTGISTYMHAYIHIHTLYTYIRICINIYCAYSQTNKILKTAPLIVRNLIPVCCNIHILRKWHIWSLGHNHLDMYIQIFICIYIYVSIYIYIYMHKSTLLGWYISLKMCIYAVIYQNGYTRYFNNSLGNRDWQHKYTFIHCHMGDRVEALSEVWDRHHTLFFWGANSDSKSISWVSEFAFSTGLGTCSTKCLRW
jgi:hypothetical protein